MAFARAIRCWERRAAEAPREEEGLSLNML
jgi:hypothetical protein